MEARHPASACWSSLRASAFSLILESNIMNDDCGQEISIESFKLLLQHTYDPSDPKVGGWFLG